MLCPACGNENRQEARFCDACGADLSAAQQAAEPPPEEAEPSPPDGAPEEIAGRYSVRRFLGQGGRKRVYLAEDTASGGEVALALFDTEGAAATVQARARREAQAMRELGEHPHVVSVRDTGEADGNPFIVSEYMPGGDVVALLDAGGGRLPVERAVRIAIDVSKALDHAHGRGIVHRDLKPANVWLDDDGSARLGDFGLATTEGRSRVSGGTLVGTVAYLPPEQALGKDAGPRSDLYSLGALLYEMLTGQPPFPGDDAVSIISQHLYAEPVPPSRHNPEVPRALDELIGELLAKDADERPPGATAVRERLLAILERGPDAEAAAEETANPLDSLAGGVFVGRDAELNELREALDGALAGHGGLVMLLGEPGIGKTRTAEELATLAQIQGAPVHWGRCREDEGAPAYWPWVQAIRSYVREADPVALAWQMGSSAEDVAQIVPEVGERLGTEPAERSPDSEQDRFRLFDSVTSFLSAVGRDRPMVIVLDDLHWADEPSLLLLRFLARELSGTGLLIVATYRDVELGRQHPLSRMLSELAEVESARRVHLHGLDEADVARYIEMTIGQAPPPGLAEAVHEQTEGNPFFLAEVVRLLASEGSLSDGARASWELTIPEGVRDVVGRRLDRLSEPANELLRTAAAIGRGFELEVLERVAERPPDELAETLTEAVAARLLERRDGDRYAFSHALVRETLYEEVSAAQRPRLHERIGRALEEVHAGQRDDGVEDHLDELAHHFLAAAPVCDSEKAIDYARRAAAQAIARLAYEEAADDYRRALEVLELDRTPDPERRCELLLTLGEAQTFAGRFRTARETFERAADAARELGDSEALARAALGVSRLSEAGAADERILSLVREALEAIGEKDSSLRVHLLHGLGQELYWVDAQGQAAPVAAEGVAMAHRLDDPEALVAALHGQIFIVVGPDAGPERMRIADEIISLSERCDDRQGALRGHVYRLREHLECGDIPAVDRELETFTRLAQELRMPQHLWHVPALRTMRALIDGDFTAAERLAEEARVGGEHAQEPLANQFFGVQMAVLRRFQGRAAELLPAIRELAVRFPGIIAWRTALAGFAVISGDRETAAREFERFAADDFAAVSRDVNWLPAMCLLGEVSAQIDRIDTAATIYETILPYEGMVIVAGRAAVAQGPVARILGLLARLLGRDDDAERHLREGLALSARMGDRPFGAQGRVDLAALLLDRGRRGDRDQALELLTEALDSAREMGARGISDPALELRLEAQGLAGVDVTTSIDEVVEALEHERPDLRAHAAPDGTVAILFSDIEDSTVLTERLGDERWLEVLRDHNAVFRRQISRHDGYEVKSQGDGFMLAFPDPRQALECAIAVQREFAERQRQGAGEPLRVRMGLHTGEVIAEEGDFFGKNVILAARIAAQAGGREILVSTSMREAAGDGDGVHFDEGRELELKGLAGTHRVYRAGWEAKAAA